MKTAVAILENESCIQFLFVQALIFKSLCFTLFIAPEYLTQVWGTGHAPWYWNSTVRFVIDIRSSSTSYSTAVDHKGFFQNNKTFTLEPPQCGRYVKVWLEAETSLSVCEIEMYGMTGKQRISFHLLNLELSQFDSSVITPSQTQLDMKTSDPIKC